MKHIVGASPINYGLPIYRQHSQWKYKTILFNGETIKMSKSRKEVDEEFDSNNNNNNNNTKKSTTLKKIVKTSSVSKSSNHKL